MDETRCPKCSRRLVAMQGAEGRTELRCLTCDDVDPLETVAAKWADSSLAAPLVDTPNYEALYQPMRCGLFKEVAVASGRPLEEQ